MAAFAATPFLAAFLGATVFATALVEDPFLAVAFPEGALVAATFLAVAVLVVDFVVDLVVDFPPAAGFRVADLFPTSRVAAAAFFAAGLPAGAFFFAVAFFLAVTVCFAVTFFFAGAFPAADFRAADFRAGVSSVAEVRAVDRSEPLFFPTGVPERVAPVVFTRDSALERPVPRVALPLLERFFATPALPRSEVLFRWIFGMKVTMVAERVNVRDDILRDVLSAYETGG